MAGYVIHIAVAQEYLRKHNKKYNRDFILGSVLPDLTKDKSKTHYGKSPAYTNLKKFLLSNDLSTELNKGEFIHLITDYLFYNHYLEFFSKKDIYNDYDISNKNIIEKYNVKLLDEIKDTVFFKEGEMKVLNFDIIYKLIDEISDFDLETVKKEVLDNNKKWTYYKNIV